MHSITSMAIKSNKPNSRTQTTPSKAATPTRISVEYVLNSLTIYLHALVFHTQKITSNIHDFPHSGIGDNTEHIELVVKCSSDPARFGLRLRSVSGNIVVTVRKITLLPTPPDTVQVGMVQIEQWVSGATIQESVSDREASMHSY